MFIFLIFGELAGVLGIFYAAATWKIWLLPLAILMYIVCRIKLEKYR